MSSNRLTVKLVLRYTILVTPKGSSISNSYASGRQRQRAQCLKTMSRYRTAKKLAVLGLSDRGTPASNCGTHERETNFLFQIDEIYEPTVQAMVIADKDCSSLAPAFNMVSARAHQPKLAKIGGGPQRNRTEDWGGAPVTKPEKRRAESIYGNDKRPAFIVCPARLFVHTASPYPTVVRHTPGPSIHRSETDFHGTGPRRFGATPAGRRSLRFQILASELPDAAICLVEWIHTKLQFVARWP
ncbi:hypothetical protein GGR50DRAFT_695443 [Xylaria sp. CBS 124048]|nr:hypothetical protein GGR50DRAFT_695443 [Xylaria sp. CBS 124048]